MKKLILALAALLMLPCISIAEPQRYDAVLFAAIEDMTMEEMAAIEEIVRSVVGCDDVFLNYISLHDAPGIEEETVEEMDI